MYKRKDDSELVKIHRARIHLMVCGGQILEDVVDMYKLAGGYFERGGPSGEHILSGENIEKPVYVESKSEKINTVTVFQDLETTDIRTICIGMLLQKILMGKFSSKIKSEYLGYSIETRFECLDNRCMMCYLVGGGREPEDVEKKIREFIESSHEIVEKLTDVEYGRHVCDLLDMMRRGSVGGGLASFFDEVFPGFNRGKLELLTPSGILHEIENMRERRRDLVEFLKKKYRTIVVYEVHKSKMKQPSV